MTDEQILKTIKELPEDAKHPHFCRNNDDFFNILFTFAGIFPEPGETRQFITAMKALCHEYFVLVIKGEVEPFTSADKIDQAESEKFITTIADKMNMIKARAGILSEDEQGNLVEKVDKNNDK